MNKEKHKVILVGDGAVGSSFAFSILQSGGVDELVIVDIKKDHTMGDALDLEDITPFSGSATVRTGDYSDASDAQIVVITAGVPRKPGETRLDLVEKNTKILESIISPVVQSGFKGCFVVSANPVDILTTMTQRLSGFPKERVIGTGTSLDSARLQVALAHKLDVDVREINAYVLGEHGDSSFANFDEAKVAGEAIRDIQNITDDDLLELESEVKKKGGQIIGYKGATFYGVAMSLGIICKAILMNEDLVLPVSAPLDGQYGLKNIYLGTVSIINGNGIQQVLEVPLSEEETKKMQHSAYEMNKVLEEVKA